MKTRELGILARDLVLLTVLAPFLIARDIVRTRRDRRRRK